MHVDIFTCWPQYILITPELLTFTKSYKYLKDLSQNMTDLVLFLVFHLFKVAFLNLYYLFSSPSFHNIFYLVTYISNFLVYLYYHFSWRCPWIELNLTFQSFRQLLAQAVILHEILFSILYRFSDTVCKFRTL